MRYTKGKWVASYKDTWSVDYTLSPIILAVMKKFREQSHKDYFGYPCCLKEDFDLPENFDATFEIWEMIIDSIIFAFDSSNEPKIKDFNLKYTHESGEPNEKGMIPVTIKVNDEEAQQQYYNAMKDYEDKCRVGRDYFSKYYNNLWW